MASELRRQCTPCPAAGASGLRVRLVRLRAAGPGQPNGSGEPASPPELSIADGSLTESSRDGNMPFVVSWCRGVVVRLDPASGSVITVEYETADGSAMAGADYTAASGTLTFAASATTATIEVAILDDTAAEETETFAVMLSNPSGATLADASADGTITDDRDSDPPDPPDPPDPVDPVDSTRLELSSLAVTGGSWGGSARGRTVTVTEAIAVSEVDPATGTAHLEVNMCKGSLDAWSYRVYRVPESEVDIPLNLP